MEIVPSFSEDVDEEDAVLVDEQELAEDELEEGVAALLLIDNLTSGDAPFLAGESEVMDMASAPFLDTGLDDVDAVVPDELDETDSVPMLKGALGGAFMSVSTGRGL